MADPYLREHARGHVSVSHAEREMGEAVRAAFRQYLTTAANAVLDRQTSGNLTAAAEPDPDLWPPRHVWNRLVETILRPVFERIWRRAFNRFLSKQQRTQLNEVEYIRQHLDDFRERLTGSTWPDEVYTAVREQIRDAYEQSETIRQIRRRVRQVLGPDQWKGRSDTIARTESLAALNGGSYRAGQARQQVFGEELHKTWIATSDTRVRDAHWLADGQTVPMSDPFRVGGEDLAFPHDPTGEPSNTINCRCTMNFLDSGEAEQARERYERMLPHRTDIHGEPLAAAGWDENAVTRDGYGQFSETPGESSGDWSPSMTREQAEKWAAESALSMPLYHGTSPEAAEALRTSGFDPDKSGSGGAAQDMTVVTDEPVTAAMPSSLRTYWTRGEGAAKIRWGTSGSFDRCVRQLREYVSDPKGTCANLHKAATGEWPAEEGVPSSAAPTPHQQPEATAVANTDETPTDQQEQSSEVADAEGAFSGEITEDELNDPAWQIPGDDEVDDDGTLTAADFTDSGAPSASKRKRAEKSGAAMRGGRFPIENRSDLRKAIMAIGRAKGGEKGRAAVKAHIKRRAKALGLTSMLPDSWKASTTAAPAATSASWYERVAEQVPDHPPADWFQNPELTGPTKGRLTAAGRVYGHLAGWDTEHASLPGVTARMFQDDPLVRFHRHPVRTAEGTRIRTGPIATGGHASTDNSVSLTAAQAHYDQPEFVAADVVTGKDEHGIWFSGALRPGVSPMQVMMLDRYSLSGDWRNGELVAACSVSVPGFHLDHDEAASAIAADAGPNRPRLADRRPRGQFADDGHPIALVAAGVVTDEQQTAQQKDGWDVYREFRAAARADQRAREVRKRINQARLSGLRDHVLATAGRHHAS